jgi:hypothetical protein
LNYDTNTSKETQAFYSRDYQELLSKSLGTASEETQELLSKSLGTASEETQELLSKSLGDRKGGQKESLLCTERGVRLQSGHEKSHPLKGTRVAAKEVRPHYYRGV